MPSSKTLTRAVDNGILSLDQFRAGEILPQNEFTRILGLERKRTERSRRRFVLMLLESSCLLRARVHQRPLEKILATLARTTRETDVKGWYKADAILGVIFTEVGDTDGGVVASALLQKITRALTETLSIEQINEIRLSFHIFPESQTDQKDAGDPPESPLYADSGRNGHNKVSIVVKRAMDIAGSSLALVIASPFLAAIAIAVKVTSNGSILFRQERIGQGGKRFTFLKFRSMKSANDPAIHQEYVKKLILEGRGAPQASDGRPIYKLTNDPRITPVGRILRRTSLDELPQFLNVLRGEMSLVGPRPPVPYEFEHYDIWHRRRLQSVKPGITGMWQVGGRSSVKFDEMVRLDLEYARSWSPWLDLKILLQTPRAVVSGEGAY